ncbi:MAG TPA: hypothetical protein PKA15_06930 [Chitinophagales bacterium]|nr:hypothetical protein [Chitinophagales bacterium]HMV02872.1 hypothetical protein [Chitinophagales bacterium]HMW94808.1 hypothetical protein [Chitinophagales bacterium]HNB38524.1 hypothetical protein [Chitinophagales bacterium]HNM67165.1 hypothetical protein [Chitinophagales bacterium]
MSIRLKFQTIETNKNEAHYVSEHDAEIIFNFLKKTKTIQRTLQIGLGDGALAFVVLSFTNKLHIAIDPDQSKVQFEGIKNLKRFELFDLVDFRVDYSSAVLPKLLEGNVLPDLTILDNDQTFDKMINDFVNIDLICKKGSIILIRKSKNPNNYLLHQYITKNRVDYSIVELELEHFVLYEKIARDIRSINDFQGINC